MPASPCPWPCAKTASGGTKERLFERIVPRFSDAAASRLLQSAHIVDGIVKGLKVPDWPADGWQALHRLALQLCKAVK